MLQWSRRQAPKRPAPQAWQGLCQALRRACGMGALAGKHCTTMGLVPSHAPRMPVAWQCSGKYSTDGQ
ncbi:hypothetical protein ACHAW6_002169 [Cyclotella cf. meneghiniana]